MTQEEAINILLENVGFSIEELKNFEQYNDGTPEIIKMLNETLEAYSIVLGVLDPELATVEGLKTRYEEAIKKDDDCDEPSEIEKELYKILQPWHEKNHEDFYLDDDENDELIELSKEGVQDKFAFYPYRDRVFVIYDFEDRSFASYNSEFQTKALEFIKAELNEQ